jgi:hypothetical protein
MGDACRKSRRAEAVDAARIIIVGATTTVVPARSSTPSPKRAPTAGLRHHEDRVGVVVLIREGPMALSKRQIGQLQKIIANLQAILAAEEPSVRSRKQTSRVRVDATRARRSGKELAAFRKTLRAERRSGVPVAEIAKRHKVSKSYIYQL